MSQIVSCEICGSQVARKQSRTIADTLHCPGCVGTKQAQAYIDEKFLKRSTEPAAENQSSSPNESLTHHVPTPDYSSVMPGLLRVMGFMIFFVCIVVGIRALGPADQFSKTVDVVPLFVWSIAGMTQCVILNAFATALSYIEEIAINSRD